MARGSRNRRDDLPSNSERTAEQRERDRLEREARRAPGQAERPPSTPSSEAQPPPTPELHDRQPPIDPPARHVRRERAGAGDPPPPPARGGASDRRGARRRPTTPDNEQPAPLLHIQPDPPAPPAAPAGALDDETERPIGIRRARRAVSARPSRTIVTPPGDVRAGPARARRSAGARIAAVIALLILAALIIGVLMLFQPFGSAQGAPVKVTIPSGSSAGDIGDTLSSSGVVASGLLFSVRATLAGKRADLRSGSHALNRGMSYGAAIDALSEQPVVAREATVDVTIPEGRSRREIARLIDGKELSGDYVQASKRFSGRLNPFEYGASKGTRSLEGFLFPATYELKSAAPAGDLVDRQLTAFRDNFEGVDLRRARRRKLTGYDVLIIASMVEREAQLAGERATIAAVIYNRLQEGIPLGIDATIRYATDNWTRPLKLSELQIDSPYNTRKRMGLPPTPIGNPGLASIRAAAAPANVDFRYYVVKPGTCGEHAFSSSFEQFDRDRQRYDQARDAAGGNSPTTC
ncbi:MAG: endolytic transglycosylase MltG [Solirubrobacteraceae bacterium]